MKFFQAVSVILTGVFSAFVNGAVVDQSENMILSIPQSEMDYYVSYFIESKVSFEVSGEEGTAYSVIVNRASVKDENMQLRLNQMAQTTTVCLC